MAQEETVHAAANGAPQLEAAANGAKKSKADKERERRKKKKLNKQLRRQQGDQAKGAAGGAAPASEDGEDEDIVIEYVSAPLDLDALRGDAGGASTAEAEPEEDLDRPGLGGLGFGGLGFTRAEEPKPQASADPFEEFKKVFERFASAEEVTGTAEAKDEDEDDVRGKDDKKATTSDQEADNDSDEEEGEGVEGKLSKKKLKLLNRLKVAELKAVCARPEVVEVWDVTAPDPPLLVFLKAYRNTVPVPRHWSQKRKYLQGKRGLEKPPFKLPEFIEATGIAEMRSAYQAKEDAKKMKQKQRERMAPKMGRMDIDYQVLHDAFFKHQKPPPLTGVGELYYEGKEFEARITHCRPGDLSEALQGALGMSDNSPPPWLINMQRYGPPPSYPNLKVPGLNAPIPPGCSFGYHPGGWGKPPVDQDGNPLYGDVFGEHGDGGESDEEVDKETLWGVMDEVEEESSEEEEEEQEQEEDGGQALDEEAMSEGIASGLASGMVSGLASGIASSLPSGIETPDTINLRKDAEGPRQLYTVLEQKQVAVGTSGIMGTDHVYVIPGAGAGADKQQPGGAGGKKKPDFLKHIGADVEVTISPEELEGLDEAQVKALYDAKVAELRSANRREDFSDMVAAKAAQQKRKQQAAQDSKTAKKAKGGDTFKF
ncbi:hypothetical protein PLESTB_001460500 [Pleodorina starrii]|uniref:PSP proline-rich domain-containing protein n=1 Tax=Pleodorina starrii TaxID=330485 RepID=A0A9W6BW69_9CHLO|nr:hypothetical protein PLESTM_001678500 [Pleodorina starrii]GLC59193.1 hypothetical protein PLESTB_001460500 [Pleodorina starrii]GLC74756.1 hypothetical protein PLESTF_001552900 [Pleodorina starrii]